MCIGQLMENFKLIAENAEEPTIVGDGEFMEGPAADDPGEYYDEVTGEVMPHPTDKPELTEEISALGAIAVNEGTDLDIVYSFQEDCETTDTYMVTINAEYRDIPNGVDVTPIDFVSEIGPHGGPDADSPEFNPDVITPFNLQPGESGSVTVEGLSVMGLYEWITPTQDFPIESFDGSGVDFEACATTSDEPAEKEPDEPPVDDIDEKPDGDNEGELVEDEASVDEVNELTGTGAEEVTTEHAEQQQPEKELPMTGGDPLLLAAMGLVVFYAGVETLRRSGPRKA